jgi:hypothetical protein
MTPAPEPAPLTDAEKTRWLHLDIPMVADLIGTDGAIIVHCPVALLKRIAGYLAALDRLRAAGEADKARIAELENIMLRAEIACVDERKRAEAAEANASRLREALEEICRCTDLRAGNGDRHVFGIASAALRTETRDGK